MGSKGTPDKLVTSLDTTPNLEIEVSTLIAPGTLTPSGNFNNFDTATRISLVSPDKNLDTANRSSWVWQYFKPVTVDGTPYNVCQVSIVAGGTELCLKHLTVDRKKSTTSMANHLDRKHRIYNKKLSTGAITNFLDKPGHLKRLDRNSLTSAGQQVLRDQLREVQSKISLTCDTWTSPSNDLVLGVTAHWIDSKFSLKLLTGKNLSVEVIEDFNIGDKIFCITSDNASNNQTMGAHLVNLTDFDNQHCLLGCMAHVINLAAQAGIKVFSEPPPPPTALPGGLMNILIDGPDAVEVKTIISQIKGLASFMKHSPQKAKSFAQITGRKQGAELALITDVSTRWNSTFEMLHWASELRECISIFCNSHNVTDQYDLEEHEWKKLDQLCDFLKHPFGAINTITTKETVSLGLAASVYTMLIKRLNEAKMSYQAQELIPAADTMLNKLTGIYEIMKDDKETIMEMFTIEAQQFASDRYNQTSNEPNPKAPKNTLKSSKRRKITFLNNKVDCYLSSETEEDLSDPLLYWKANSEHLPSLASMARTYLAVPASSAPSERAASAGRHIQDYTRSRMCVVTLKALICLNNWVDEKVIDVDQMNKTTT
ncbi:hypothetical protein PSTG_07648 [Puccinia striiformis f. sp. tritici PST-78]|uniref:HAT C-terminal dimerisation domain-containing protein n=1 Tax=Puccinia striiformis f. sp. tritici PST-78 TaxID=1165861 RepID=A0A0L0VI92_9BASI|nr:hypothetical protein PSTG_07648 [Puccinia striiformis f. sp. tritici PST-78]